EGTIGNLRTLISAETDAVFDHEDPVELKCSYKDHLADDRRSDVWLQAFLSGVERIVFGQYTGADELARLDGEIRIIHVEPLIEEIAKNTLISTLHEVLQFLSERVNENQVYLLSRRFDRRAGRHGVYLYTVGDQDRIRLTFIRRETFDEVNNTNPVITQQMSTTSEDPQAANYEEDYDYSSSSRSTPDVASELRGSYFEEKRTKRQKLQSKELRLSEKLQKTG
ncbi:unnamed protein product, partial [Adineta ricciae]